MLHARLAEAGFDGMLWQAGLGNPVSFANFLLEHREGGARRWVWVDLESGVPALFALDPRAHFGTYLPACWRHRAALFDHTDTARLRSWLETHADELRNRLGEQGLQALRSDAAALQVCDAGFWQLSRVQRSIASQVAKGKVTAEEASHWVERPGRWWSRELLRGSRGAWRRG